jgi:hypothetical protein
VTGAEDGVCVGIVVDCPGGVGLAPKLALKGRLQEQHPDTSSINNNMAVIRRIFFIILEYFMVI